MTRALGLDIGDVWIGVAISDPLGIGARPYTTVTLNNLESFLEKIIPEERITTIVVGYPKTLSGTESEQTKKVVQFKETLAEKYALINEKPIEWVLWDERLSSKRAQTLSRELNSKSPKEREHAVAAAFILQGYLDHQAAKRLD